MSATLLSFFTGHSLDLQLAGDHYCG